MDNQPSSNLIMLTYVVYGLHLFSAINGVMSSAFVVTAFLTGWPSILAVLINYIKRSDTGGTYLESHFRWQIRTFWFSALWLLIAGGLILTVILFPLGLLILVLVGIWVLYRMFRGVLALTAEKSLPMP